MGLSQTRILEIFEDVSSQLEQEEQFEDAFYAICTTLFAVSAEAAQPDYFTPVVELMSLLPDYQYLSGGLASAAASPIAALLSTLDEDDPELKSWCESPARRHRLIAVEALNPENPGHRAKLEVLLADPIAAIRERASDILQVPIPEWAVAFGSAPPRRRPLALKLAALYEQLAEEAPQAEYLLPLVKKLPRPLLLDFAQRVWVASLFEDDLRDKVVGWAADRAPVEWVWQTLRAPERDPRPLFRDLPRLRRRTPQDALRLGQLALAEAEVAGYSVWYALSRCRDWLEPDTDRSVLVEAWKKLSDDAQERFWGVFLGIFPREKIPFGLEPHRTPQAEGQAFFVEMVLREWSPELRAQFKAKAQDLSQAFTLLRALRDNRHPRSRDAALRRSRVMTLLAILWRAQPGKVRRNARADRATLFEAAPDQAPLMAEIDE